MLFPLMGDQEGQDRIRAATPTERHCGLLAKLPDACLICDLQENPYKGKADLALALATHGELAAEALELQAEWEVGLLDKQDLMGMTPEEVAAISTVTKELNVRAIRIQAELIASLFAPKEKANG